MVDLLSLWVNGIMGVWAQPAHWGDVPGFADIIVDFE